MNALLHLLFGFACFAVLHAFLPQFFPLTATNFAVVALGSILPDIDARKSRAFKLIIFILFVCISVFSFKFLEASAFAEKNNIILVAISLFAGALAAALFYLIPFKHRGRMHSALAAAVFAVIVFVSTGNAAAAILALIAYAGHLVGDQA
jgi:membrane-bound metal-dependent hydrolase YbcI (DUF457 family)